MRASTSVPNAMTRCEALLAQHLSPVISDLWRLESVTVNGVGRRRTVADRTANEVALRSVELRARYLPTRYLYLSLPPADRLIEGAIVTYLS